jgi:hypothetical protein
VSNEKPKFDLELPYSTMITLDPKDKRRYNQDGVYFDDKFEYVGEDPSRKSRLEAANKRTKAVEKAEEAKRKAEKVRKLLSLEGLNEAENRKRREDRAALAAEERADDA